MKNIINYALALVIIVSLISCNEDDYTTSPDENFFNLNVGNRWVYKKYENSYNNPTQFTFNGVIDTVKIVGNVEFSGLTFAKKITKRVNINTNGVIYEKTTYVRVNNQGHLVEINDYDTQSTINESSGFVLHPGFDSGYIYLVEEPYGIIEYKLHPQTTMNVEGSTYNITPYNGVFTPSESHPDLISKTVEYNYEHAIGLVRFICHAVSSNYSWEERLVDYEIVD